MSQPIEFTLSCPIPISDYPAIQLAHGGGGRLMNQLITGMFAVAFRNPLLDQRHDASAIDWPAGARRLAFTTDSCVVHPLFFPGGDIGKLAVFGTANDLAMAGARPAWLSAGFILEEGLPMETLWRVVQSMSAAAAETGAQIVTGDTKVVDRGKCDGIFINTSGVGIIGHDLVIAPSSVREGDAVLISGDVGRHGMAIMAEREGLSFESSITSDCAPLASSVMALLDAGITPHCLRDLTRGGLASALNEIARDSGMEIVIDEKSVAVSEEVRGACEIFGFDPLYVANEGRFTAFVPEPQAAKTLARLKAQPGGSDAAIIGRVKKGSAGLVTLKSAIGAMRILDMLSGEQLPRIC
ncbi:MAG: hydrogenase expression/formation protein HypE [Candidatus Sumerlaeota bacterium]|nr:hydrogenase expression/formation protein HypE [Candidatus Sumerlaeota bacterium]